MFLILKYILKLTHTLEIKNNMKTKALLTIFISMLCAYDAKAFPPAPYHEINGIVRDELGRTLMGEDINIILITDNGKVVQGSIGDYNKNGINYKLKIPMDSGLTSDVYIPTAMRPAMPFQIRVTIAGKVYLPIEMVGQNSRIGKPGEITRLDLNLGEDKDGDGLPDAWERTMLSGNQGIRDINPNDDTDGDGLSNIDEYISGNYAYDKEDGFVLKLISNTQDKSVVEFLGITGKTYSVYTSSNLKEWKLMEFNVQGEEEAAKYYKAKDVKNIRFELKGAKNNPASNFYKLMVE